MEGGNSVDFGEFLSFKQLWIFKPELLSQQVFSSKTLSWSELTCTWSWQPDGKSLLARSQSRTECCLHQCPYKFCMFLGQLNIFSDVLQEGRGFSSRLEAQRWVVHIPGTSQMFTEALVHAA